MTGTERAALRLALSMLRSRREWRWHEIANALEAGGAEDYVPGMRRWSTESPSLLVDRQLTCRVALYIRALLRAERGDEGTWARVEWPGGDDGPGASHHARMHEAVECARRWTLNERAPHVARLARPLWLDAPEHR